MTEMTLPLGNSIQKMIGNFCKNMHLHQQQAMEQKKLFNSVLITGIQNDLTYIAIRTLFQNLKSCLEMKFQVET